MCIVKKIRIFKGKPGEGAFSVSADNLKHVLTMALQDHKCEVKFISSDDIKNGALLSPEETDLFVIGGGRFTEVKQALGEDGVRNIQKYTYEGGIYTGICMGSYAAFADIDFYGADRRRGTGFGYFNLTARGSLPLAMPFDGTANSATIIEVQHMKRDLKFPTLYWGGNGMDEAELLQVGAEPLSKIHFANGQEKVMGAKIKVGDNGGQAFLCSYHPEGCSWRIVHNWLKGLDPTSACYTRLYYEMKQHPDKAYLMATACLLDDINLIPNHSFIRQVEDGIRHQVHSYNELEVLSPYPISPQF